MALEIFDVALKGHTVGRLGSEDYAEAARATLDAVQKVVNVLTDGKTGGYEACFTADQGAFTALGARRISVSSRPLRELPLPEAATIITGFVVHEVGHTILTPTMTELVAAKYGSQRLPHRVQNVIEDVRLEAYMAERFAGLRGVFDPTMEYVHKSSGFPTGDMAYGQFRTIAERLNFVSGATRYRKYCTFSADTETQTELAWWREWANVDGSTTDAELMVRIEDALQHLHAPYSEQEPDPDTEGEDGEPGDTEGEGEGNDADGDSTEGGDKGKPGKGKPKPDSESTEGADDADDGDGTEGGDTGSGDTEGDDGDDSAEGNDGTEGDRNADAGDSDTPAADPYRVGGGAQGTTPAADMDDGFDEAQAPREFDEVASNGDRDYESRYQDKVTQEAVEKERSSTKFNAGDFGTLKVHANF